MQKEFILPVLEKGLIPRLAAIHDICGYGNCSLAVVMPVVSLAGVDVLPIPTSVVSAQTNLDPFALLDTTSFLPEYMDSWEKLGIDVAGIYTGFLGSSEQISIIEKYFQYEDDAFKVVDPVMGDHGKAYPTYTKEMCDEMKRLVPYADVLIPNITEASLLLDIDYPGQELTSEQAEEILDQFLKSGAKAVVLKGINRGENVVNAIKGNNFAYQELANPLHEKSLHGTGDLFASCVVAGLFSGHSLADSVSFAGHFVYDAIELSTSQPGFQERGVNFEPLLGKVVEFCQKA